MRSIPVIALILLVLLASCDNLEITEQQSETFVKYFGVGDDDAGVKVLSTSSGYLILANVDNPRNGRDICIIRTDFYGNITGNMLVYGSPFDDYGYNIISNENGYLIVGSTQESSLSTKDIYVIQITGNGSIEWERSYSLSDGNDEAYDAAILGNGDIALTGYSESETYKRDVFFMRLSASGDILEENVLNLDGNEEAFAIDTIHSEFFLFGGYREKKGTTGQRELYLFKWYGIGPPQSITVAEQERLNTTARSIIRDKTNGFLVICNTSVTSGNQATFKLIKINEDVQSASWIRNYGERAVNRANCIAIRDSHIYVTGTSTNETSGQGDILLLQVNEQGTDPRYNYFGDGTAYQGGGFAFAPNGGFVITGSSRLNEFSSIALLKVMPD